MSEPDVVGELDAWIETETRQHHVPPDGAGLIAVTKVQRARDEIVALRERLDNETLLRRRGYDLALEEGARACDAIASDEMTARLAHGHNEIWWQAVLQCAAAVRALKDKRDD